MSLVTKIRKAMGVKKYTLKLKADKNGRVRHYIYADGKPAKKEGTIELYLKD